MKKKKRKEKKRARAPLVVDRANTISTRGAYNCANVSFTRWWEVSTTSPGFLCKKPRYMTGKGVNDKGGGSLIFQKTSETQS